MRFTAASAGSGRSEYVLVGIMVAIVMLGSLFAVSEGGFLFSFDYGSGASSPSASAGFSARAVELSPRSSSVRDHAAVAAESR